MPQKAITPQSDVATEIGERYALWLATLEEGETPKDYEYFAWIRHAGHAFRLSLRLHPEAPIGRHPGFTEFLRTYGANGIPLVAFENGSLHGSESIRTVCKVQKPVCARMCEKGLFCSVRGIAQLGSAFDWGGFFYFWKCCACKGLRVVVGTFKLCETVCARIDPFGGGSGRRFRWLNAAA